MIRWLSFFAAVSTGAATSFVAAHASAQVTSGDFKPYAGTARYQAVIDGTITNARVYGAVGALERNILPNMTRDGQFVTRFEVNQLWGASRLPGACLGNSGVYNCTGRSILGDVDLFSTSLGVGYKWKSTGIFYSAGVTGSATLDTSFERYFIYNGIAPAYGLGYSLVAPFTKTAHGTTIGSVQRDWIAGFDFDVTVMKIRVGYLGSQGLFTNLSQDTLRLFATSLLSDQLKQLSYLKAGIDRLELVKNVGQSSAFVRRLTIASPATAATGVVADDFRTKERNAIGFLTAHLEQYSMARMFDVRAALAVHPTAFLHEAAAGFHNQNYYVPPGTTGQESSAAGEGGRVSVGYVRLPALPALGVDGAAKFTMSVELKTTYGDRYSGIPMRIMIRRNDPEILSTFPFARDAWNIYWAIGVGGI